MDGDRVLKSSASQSYTSTTSIEVKLQQVLKQIKKLEDELACAHEKNVLAQKELEATKAKLDHLTSVCKFYAMFDPCKTIYFTTEFLF